MGAPYIGTPGDDTPPDVLRMTPFCGNTVCGNIRGDPPALTCTPSRGGDTLRSGIVVACSSIGVALRLRVPGEMALIGVICRWTVGPGEVALIGVTCRWTACPVGMACTILG